MISDKKGEIRNIEGKRALIPYFTFLILIRRIKID